MAKGSPENMRARDTVYRYLIAAHLACELKCLDAEGNFSPHTVNAFARMLGRTVAMLMEKFQLEQYKARKIAQRILLTYLEKKIPYPTKIEEEWIQSEYVMADLKPFDLSKTLEEVKPLCILRIKKKNKTLNADRLEQAWGNISDEVRKATDTYLMNGEPWQISREGLMAHLCLLISRFYGLIVGKSYERKESVTYFLEREVQDYMTEEHLEINYVIQQRGRKKEN